MTVLGIGPVVLHVDPGRVPQWEMRLTYLGFRLGGDAHAADWDGRVMHSGRAQITVAAVKPGTAAAEQVAAGGDRVAVVAFYVDDVQAAYAEAIAGGAAGITRPVDIYRRSLTMAAVGGAGDLVHTLCHDRRPAAGSGGPGRPEPPGIACVALSAGCAEEVAATADFYVAAFGFSHPARCAMLRSGAAALTVARDTDRTRTGTAVHHLVLACPGARGVDLVTRLGPAPGPGAAGP
jgi:hypothetical protein